MNLKDAINLDPPYRHIQTEEERMGGGGGGGDCATISNEETIKVRTRILWKCFVRCLLVLLLFWIIYA